MQPSKELDLCYHWVKERESIRILKERGVSPELWTTDPILATYRFCNVRREDDRVTRWVKKNVREAYAGHPRLWWMLCAARQINWPWTLMMLQGYEDEEHRQQGPYHRAWPSELGDGDFSPQKMADALNDMASVGQKIFTGAYIITAPSTKGAKKTDHVALKTLGALWNDRDELTSFIDGCGWMEQVHKKLMGYDGWGPFLAYQAVVDMRFTPILEKAEDVTTWCAAGPGTLRGLNRLLQRPLTQAMGQAEARDHLCELWPQLVTVTGVDMDLSDVPNVMCETDKYLRVLNGEGKPRALYVPGRGS